MLHSESAKRLERESAIVAGQWESDVLMSILEAEYRRAKPAWG
jgi:hypothetical protein